MPVRLITTMKGMFDLIFLTAIYVGQVLVLQTEWRGIIAIALGSISGSLVLAYLKRERDHREIFYKSAVSSISGAVIGAIVTRRWEIDALEYQVGTYFFASLLSLFLLRGLATVTEQNASSWVIRIIQSFVPKGTVPSIDPGQHRTQDATITTVEVEKKSDGKIHVKEKNNGPEERN